MTVTVDPHPRLHFGAFATELPVSLGGLPSPDWLISLLAPEADAPFRPEEPVRLAVRDMLRYGGYKPTGRGKPASEYLVREAGEGRLGTINAAVDVCNVVSLHTGFPISVVDLGKAHAPFHIGLGGPEAEYVFNAAGQVIRVEGLVCLHDAEGPCANAVKDAQRTKTDEHTKSTLSIVWGVVEEVERTERAVEWYRELLGRLGAETRAVRPTPASGTP